MLECTNQNSGLNFDPELAITNLPTTGLWVINNSYNLPLDINNSWFCIKKIGRFYKAIQQNAYLCHISRMINYVPTPLLAMMVKCTTSFKG